MKNTLILTIVLTFFTISSIYSQKNKCKFDYSKEDPFTKKLEVVDKFWVGEKGVKCQIGIGKMTNDIFLVGYMLGGEKNKEITTNDSVMIMLENSEIITLFPNANVPPTSYVAGNAVYTNYSIVCNVTKEQLKLLATLKITAVKYPYDNSYIAAVVSESKAEKFMKSSNCVLSLE